jgi:hypothetical protein
MRCPKVAAAISSGRPPDQKHPEAPISMAFQAISMVVGITKHCMACMRVW